MNIENKRQLATIIIALGLRLLAAYLMGEVVKTQVNEQTKILVNDYQGKSAVLVKVQGEQPG